jgi:hypothetical protein
MGRLVRLCVYAVHLTFSQYAVNKISEVSHPLDSLQSQD